MFSYLIIPFFSYSVSISTENLSIFLIIAKSQLIDLSNLNLSKSLFHFSKFLILVNGPRHPFRLSYSIRPCLNESVAIFCKLILIGVLIFNPCL